jgi:methyl-accepting chemotaxis protein
MISRLPISRQFIILAILGVLFTVTGVTLALKRTYDLAFDARSAELRHMSEAAVTLVKSYVAMEHRGALSRADAQQQAKDAVESMRFDGGNY